MLRFSVVFNLNSKRIPVKFSESTKGFKVAFKDFQTATVTPEAYTGNYEVVPKSVDQTLKVDGQYMLSDVVVKAIPKEYGLVTYDQSKTITVS